MTTVTTATRDTPGTAVGAVPSDAEELRGKVRDRYAAAARRATAGAQASCCGPEAADASALTSDPITSGLYSDQEAQGLPEAALLASLGCGNPTALAELHAGETVLDLGSGGGIDVLLSAKRVGPTGFAYGLDMTDEMLALAEQNRQKAGAENVRFLKGTIEQIPLPDNAVDVIISNCVINLSADKDAVLRETFRVLKPGGRFAVSDMVVIRDLPESVQRSMEAWAGCVAGALHQRDYVAKLTAAGFAAPEVQPTRTFGVANLDTGDAAGARGGSCCGPAVNDGVTQAGIEAAEGALASAFIRATKPVAAI
jgi:SAM-dependent methyltransferase